MDTELWGIANVWDVSIKILKDVGRLEEQNK